MSTTTTCRVADWCDAGDAAVALDLLDAYARDPMGGGEPLSEYARANLAKYLSSMPHAFTALAFVGDVPAGLANCFEGFSTFACKPLVNIHDFAVLPQWRGRGVSKVLMSFVEQEARRRGACKITLEVLQGNTAAQALYAGAGFSNYQLDPAMGYAQFLQKYL
jgi:ribosomal protein S18 acetylase RimI-like enzyme